MQFKIQIFQVWKVMESALGPGNSWQMHIKCPRKSWKTTFSVLYPPWYLFSCIFSVIFVSWVVRRLSWVTWQRIRGGW